jgi:uncharacterized protein YndB with AHSA1/START domain
VVTRLINGPARLVFEAWTRPDLFRRWWTPTSFNLTVLSCELDARTGGTYRLVIRHPASEQLMAFFGIYLEVVPGSRLVWTNEESGGGGAVTTVTFEEVGDATKVVVKELYATKQACDEAVASGSCSGWPEQFDQLEGLLSNEPKPPARSP